MVPTGAVVLARYVPVGTSSPLLILSVVHNSSKEETPVIFVFYQTGEVAGSQCQMHSIFVSSTADAPPGVSGVSKDQKFHVKSDLGSLKR